jgi:hypothetical protein
MSKKFATPFEAEEFDQWVMRVRQEKAGTILEGIDIDQYPQILRRHFDKGVDPGEAGSLVDLCAEMNFVNARNDRSFIEHAGEPSIVIFETYLGAGNVNRAAKVHQMTRSKADVICGRVRRLLIRYHCWDFGLADKARTFVKLMNLNSLQALKEGIESGSIKPGKCTMDNGEPWRLEQNTFLDLVAFCGLDPDEIAGRLASDKTERSREALQRRLDAAAELLRKNGYKVTKD